jgi:vacuolar-type H+-ATPase subunit I/STV1
MANTITPVQQTDAAAQTDDTPSKKKVSVEGMALLVGMQNITKLEQKVRDELKTLSERRNQVTTLHKLLKSLNSVTDDKGEANLSKNPEIKEMLEKAKELGLEIPPIKDKYTKDERTRLVENIRTTCDDLNIQNDMQVQTISRMTNERHEAFQMMRGILKPAHEDKVNKARAIRGS